MTQRDYMSMKREIRRLEAADPAPHHTSNVAVKLYTLKAAALAYEQGLFPFEDPAPPGATAP